MKHALILFKVSILVCFVVLVGACGKMSDPKPIEDIGYPHVYPKI